MRFADEVVPPGELDDVLPAKQPKVGKREVEMAEQLIDSLTRDFDPSAYRDEYREELLALIERKADGEDVLAGVTTEEPKATKAPDLMAALEESIAAVKGKSDGKPAKKPAKRKPKKAAPRKKAKAAK
jgi:DNA end-binding protein Ku